jgi:hypothetical protein
MCLATLGPSVTALAQEPTTAGPLPGVSLVTEEVEPGVLRIVSDGHRDITRPVVGESYRSTFYESNLAAGLDGSVWIFGPESFFRLGDPRSHPSDRRSPAFLGTQVEVGADGVVWTTGRRGDMTLRSFDGEGWQDELEGVSAFDLATDGTVWANASTGLQRLGPDGWISVGDHLDLREHPLLGEGPGEAGWPGGEPRFWVSPVVHEPFMNSYGPSNAEIEILTWPGPCAPGRADCLIRDIGLTLIGIASNGGPGGGVPAEIRRVDMGDGGDWWILQRLEVPLAGSGHAGSYPTTRTIDYLVHVEGGPMTIHTNDEGVPEMTAFYDWGAGFMSAAPDGSVWLTPGGGLGIWGCDGLANFDGQTWTRYLRGTCIYALDVATDGTVWAQGGTWDGRTPGPVETFAIPAVTTASD